MLNAPVNRSYRLLSQENELRRKKVPTPIPRKKINPYKNLTSISKEKSALRDKDRMKQLNIEDDVFIKKYLSPGYLEKPNVHMPEKEPCKPDLSKPQCAHQKSTCNTQPILEKPPSNQFQMKCRLEKFTCSALPMLSSPFHNGFGYYETSLDSTSDDDWAFNNKFGNQFYDDSSIVYGSKKHKAKGLSIGESILYDQFANKYNKRYKERHFIKVTSSRYCESDSCFDDMLYDAKSSASTHTNPCKLSPPEPDKDSQELIEETRIYHKALIDYALRGGRILFVEDLDTWKHFEKENADMMHLFAKYPKEDRPTIFCEVILPKIFTYELSRYNLFTLSEYDLIPFERSSADQMRALYLKSKK